MSEPKTGLDAEATRRVPEEPAVKLSSDSGNPVRPSGNSEPEDGATPSLPSMMWEAPSKRSELSVNSVIDGSDGAVAASWLGEDSSQSASMWPAEAGRRRGADCISR